MQVKKKLSLILAWVLIFSMILPNFVFAALPASGTLVAGKGKAKMELVYLEADSEAAAGTFQYKEVETPAFGDEDIGKDFFVGVRVTGLGNLTDAAAGLYSVSHRLILDEDYVTFEPTAQNASGTFQSGRAVNLIKARMNYTGSLWEAPYDEEFNTTPAYAKVGEYAYGFGNTSFSRAEINVEFKWQIPNDDTTSTPIYTAADEDSFWVAVYQFRVKAIPEGGKKVISFVTTAAAKQINILLGAHAGQIQYDWYGDGVTDEQLEANKEALENVMELDASKADVFPHTYTLTYDDNTGTGKQYTDLTGANIGTGDTSVKAGKTISSLPAGTATHTDGTSWAIASWNTKPDGTGTKIEAGTTKITDEMAGEDGTITLYAQWEQKYIITFDGNGGKDANSNGLRTYEFGPAVSGTLDTINGMQDQKEETVVLPAIDNSANGFSRDNYTFDGWYKADGSGYYTPTTKITNWSDENIGSATYFINWIDPVDPVTVTFDANGTAWDDSNETKTVTVNKNDMINPDPSTSTLAENMPAPPTRTGYEFKGWNTQANGAGDAFTGKTAVDADKTVYAVWELAPDTPAQNTVIINFDLGLDGMTVPEANKPTITKNPYNVYVGAAGGEVTVDESIIPTLSSESVTEAGGKEWSFVGWQITTIGGTAPGTDTMYEKGVKFNAVAGDSTTVNVTAKWGETKSIKLHLGALTDSEKTALGDLYNADEDVVVVKGVNGNKLTDSADYKALITKVDSTAETIEDAKLHGHWGVVGLASAARADNADASKMYDNADSIVFGTDTDVYVYWQLLLSVRPGANTLSYTGAVLDWNADPTNPAIDIWYTDSDSGEVDEETSLPIYTARANGDLTAADHYTVEFYDAAIADNPPAIDLKDAKDYTFNFTSKKAASTDGTIEAYDPIVFDVELDTLTVEPMAIKVKVNSLTGGSKGTAPESGSTSGAALETGDGKGIELVLPADFTDDEAGTMKAAMEASIQVKYNLLNESAPVTPNTYDTPDLKTGPDATNTEEDPYIIGKYIMVISTKAGTNFKVTEVEFADENAYALTETSTPDKLASDLANSLNIADGAHTAVLYTVEISNRTVTFKYPTSMPSDGSAPTLDGTPVEIELENGTAIKDNEGKTIPSLDKIMDYPLAGWFVATGEGEGSEYDKALANYNTWKADKDANAALKFDANTVVNDDVTVVAIWVKSDDGTLQPIPDDPETPDDDESVPALAVKVYKDDGTATGIPAKEDDGTTEIAETITGFKQSDYSTDQEFTPADTSIEYYIRVDNKYDYAEIQWNTAEDGSTVVIKKNQPGDDGADNYVEVASYVIGGLSVMAQGSKSVVLDVAKDANANDFQIVITPPAGAGTDNANVVTYTLHIQREAKAEIRLNYGNSPYGLIMNDPYVNSANSAYGKTEAEIKTWQDTAKAEFIKNNRFTNEAYKPLNSSSKIYSVKAWVGEDTTSETALEKIANADINLDRNEYAIFVYNKRDFCDPGFTAVNSIGEEVKAEDVTRSITVVRIGSGIVNLGSEGVSDTLTFKEALSTYKYTTITDKATNVNRIKPGVYQMTYTFEDPYITDPNNDGDDDGTPDKLVRVIRYVVVLNDLGDADANGALAFADATAVANLVNGVTNYGSFVYKDLFNYRVADADGNGALAFADGTAVVNIVNGTVSEDFYPALTGPESSGD